jgi:hypothetical protein
MDYKKNHSKMDYGYVYIFQCTLYSQPIQFVVSEYSEQYAREKLMVNANSGYYNKFRKYCGPTMQEILDSKELEYTNINGKTCSSDFTTFVNTSQVSKNDPIPIFFFDCLD